MKKIILSFTTLLLIASFGYCQDQPLSLTIKSDKKVHGVEENILVEFTMKNLSNERVKPFYILNESKIVINDNEYDLHVTWRGNAEGTIGPGEEYVYRYVNLKVFDQIKKPGTFSIIWKYSAFVSNP